MNLQKEMKPGAPKHQDSSSNPFHQEGLFRGRCQQEFMCRDHSHLGAPSLVITVMVPGKHLETGRQLSRVPVLANPGRRLGLRCLPCPQLDQGFKRKMCFAKKCRHHVITLPFHGFRDDIDSLPAASYDTLEEKNGDALS